MISGSKLGIDVSSDMFPEERPVVRAASVVEGVARPGARPDEVLAAWTLSAADSGEATAVEEPAGTMAPEAEADAGMAPEYAGSVAADDDGAGNLGAPLAATWGEGPTGAAAREVEVRRGLFEQATAVEESG